MTGTGRFTLEAMTAAMHQVAEQLGVRADGAQLLRFTNNAVFALPSAGIVIRLARSHRLADRAYKVVELGRWFKQVNAPTIRLAPDVAQPVQAGGFLASIWKHIPPTAPNPTVKDLGSVLRKFHSLGPLPMPLPTWDPIGDARSRIVDAEGLSDEDRRFLLDWCDRLDAPVAAIRRRAGSGLVHGDAHVGNLLRPPTGRALLCDFDATCLGPWQVDLVAVAVGEVRFGRRGAHAALADAYGYDVTTDPDWPLLREARELKMIAAAVPVLHSSVGVHAEFATRLRSIQEGHHDARWKPFAEVGRRPPYGNSG
ncbi:aminoglycoside phosphotransferase family protein [Micromonospora sp. NPDC048999]|uniref:aminoglycoside phosphotransferase family protein n=1 Tax=Micromonospora sp. NPDC048999 TaxID=3155391 RepID=UPI0033F41C64